jgi:hypothetical protein
MDVQGSQFDRAWQAAELSLISDTFIRKKQSCYPQRISAALGHDLVEKGGRLMQYCLGAIAFLLFFPYSEARKLRGRDCNAAFQIFILN